MSKLVILPCVCCDHEPTQEDSVFYGMPEIRVYNTLNGPEYVAYCPKCGRGGFSERRTVQAALKQWNGLQENLKLIDVWE